MTGEGLAGAARRAGLMAILVLLAPPARPEVVPNGTLVVSPTRNGVPVSEPDVEIAIRTREVDPPPIVSETHNKLRFELPAGRYDCVIFHDHIFTRPLRYHSFEVRPGETVTLQSDVKTHFLEPAAGSVAGIEQLTVTNPNSGESVRLRYPGPVELPEAPYRVEWVRRDGSGQRIRRETELYLGCDARLEL